MKSEPGVVRDVVLLLKALYVLDRVIWFFPSVESLAWRLCWETTGY